MSTLARLEQTLSDITAIEDFDLRSELLIEIADRYKPVSPTIAVRPFAKDHLVPGCESEAYMWATKNPDDSVKFHYAVENPQGLSAMCLAVILDESLSGLPPRDIEQLSEDIVYKIFGEGLSMGKGIGLKNMVGMAKSLAASF